MIPERQIASPVGAYAYIDGNALVDLVLEIRDEFLARIPYEMDDARRPNSLQLVAIDVLEEKATEDQLRILRDLIELNPDFIVARGSEEIFAHADTPATHIADLICEVACQVLRRNLELRNEDERRLALASESVTELDEA